MRRRRSGILRPRNSGGAGTGRASRAASSFRPKRQPIRAICAVSKASLSKVLAIAPWRYGASAGLQRGRGPAINGRAYHRELIGMPRFRTLDDLDVAGKRVLLRADLNVP